MSMFLIGQTLKKGATDDEKTDFLKEAHLMRWEEPSVVILFSVSLLVSFNKIINVCNYIYGNMCVCVCVCVDSERHVPIYPNPLPDRAGGQEKRESMRGQLTQK